MDKEHYLSWSFLRFSDVRVGSAPAVGLLGAAARPTGNRSILDAKIRTVDGTFFLDLRLPRGADGRDGFSNIPGPAGRPGADAVTDIALGQIVSGRGEAMASLRHEGDVVILDLAVPHGVQGERGEIGPPGRDVKLSIGVVESGPTADARLHEVGPSSYTLHLCPKGDPGIGECGPQGLPGVGERGPAGPKGDSPSTDELRTLARQVIDANPEQFRGPM